MRFLTFLFLGLIFILPSAAIADHGIQIEAPYAFATSKTQTNGAVFMEIMNHSDQDITLIGATAGEISKRTEIHSMDMNDDMMMMRKLEKLEIPAGETATLDPMSNHIMLMGLNAPLEAGGSFPLTLTFDNEQSIETTVWVTKPGQKPDHHGHDHQHCDCDGDTCDCHSEGDCNCSEDGCDCHAQDAEMCACDCCNHDHSHDSAE